MICGRTGLRFQISSCRTASRQRESSLVLGTQFFNWHPVDAVTRIGTERTEWQAHFGSSGEGEEGRGVNPEQGMVTRQVLWL